MEPFIDFHRRSRRLKGHDYLATGPYFITVCAFSRERLFGEIIDGCAHLNHLGRMVSVWWAKLPIKFPTVSVDQAFVIMPDHLHGIIWLNVPAGADPCVRPIKEK